MKQLAQNIKSGKMELLEVPFPAMLRNNFDIEIIPVSKIQRTKSGKHRYLIQELSIGDS